MKIFLMGLMLSGSFAFAGMEVGQPIADWEWDRPTCYVEVNNAFNWSQVVRIWDSSTGTRKEYVSAQGEPDDVVKSINLDIQSGRCVYGGRLD